MTGEMSQMVVLAVYGNRFLASSEKLEGLFLPGSAFERCHSVTFARLEQYGTAINEHLIAGNPSQWLIDLKSRHCQALRLGVAPSSSSSAPHTGYASAGFANGGATWSLIALFENVAEYWQSRWLADNKDATDRKIWAVTYGRVISGAPKPIMKPTNLSEDKARLSAILISIGTFAEKNNLAYWRDNFNKAKSLLDAQAPFENSYLSGTLPKLEGSIEAKQLIAASSAAWVFGGMGSWNDVYLVGTDQQEMYQKLSSDLYQAINQGIVHAVNSLR